MKKLGFVMIAAAGLFAACTGNGPTARLNTAVDTLSYAAGVANTRGLKPYLEQQMGIDSTQMKDFIRGLQTGIKAADDKKQTAYYTGVQIGQQLSTMLDRFNYELVGNDSVKAINEDNFVTESFFQLRSDMAQRVLHITFAFRTTKVRNNNNFGTFAHQGFNGWNRTVNTSGVGNMKVFIHRNV